MVKINQILFFKIFRTLVTPLCTSTAKKSSFFNRSRSQNHRSHELFPPPPPEFLTTEKQPTIRANGPGLKDGFVDDHC
jgi:hypothetical protein